MQHPVSRQSTLISRRPVSILDRIDAYSRRFRWLQVSRLRAFAGHLGVSATIVACVFAIVFLIWYPSPYFVAVGAASIIKVLISVDLVLGPLLTLIVFRPGKRLLIIDVTCIALVQISALTYGLSVLYQERPLYTVFALDRFYIFTSQDIPTEAIEQHAWLLEPSVGPLAVSAQRPKSLEAQQRLLEETVFGNAPDIEQRPELWVPLADDVAQIRRRAYPLENLRNAGGHEAAIIDRAVRKSGVDESELGFFPVISAKNNASAIVNLRNADIVTVLDINPWQHLE